MIPILFEIGPIKVHSFGVSLAVCFLVVGWFLAREFARRKWDPDAAWTIIMGAMVGGVLGAKLYFLIDHWGDTAADPLGAVFSGAGFTYYGGFFGGVLGVILAAKKRRIPIPGLADACAPLLGMGYGIGRIGCLLNGDDYGRPTDAAWGMAFPKGTPPTDVVVHPTQIYEAIAGFLIFAVLWANRKRLEGTPGLLWGSYLVLIGIERFSVEFYRTNEAWQLGLTMAQWISIALFTLGIATIVRVTSQHQAGRKDQFR